MSSTDDIKVEYSVIQCIDIASAQIQSLVDWNGSNIELPFLTFLPKNIMDIVKQHLIPGKDNSYQVLVDLTVLPSIGITAAWHGEMEEKDWKHLNMKRVNIEGPLRIYLSKVEHRPSGTLYRFNAECGKGTVFF